MSIVDAGALSDIRERMVRVETKLDDIIGDLKTTSDARDMARDALQSAQYAHQRLNRIDRIIFWAATTIIGTIFIGSLTLLFKNQGGN